MENRIANQYFRLADLGGLYGQAEDIDTLIEASDLAEYTGLNDPSDTEAIRNYIVRTKKVIDGAPQLVQSYINPEDYSNMLDYLLRCWDTAERENAIRLMAEREQSLIAQGLIRTEDEDGYGGFFMALAAALCPEAGSVAEAMEGVTGKFRTDIRAAEARARRLERQGKITRSVIDKTRLSGLAGDDSQSVRVATLLYGHEICNIGGLSGVEQPTDNTLAYLQNTHTLMSEHPQDFFPRPIEASRFIGGLGRVIDNWEDEQRREAAIDQWQAECEQLGGFLKKAAKKVASAVKKAGKAVANVTKKVVTATVINPTKAIAKTVAKTAKTIAKNPLTLLNPVKMTKMAIKDTVYLTKETLLKPTVAVFKSTVVEPMRQIIKITKKVVKFIIRYSPTIMLIRALLCLAARKNWFNLANRCYPGSFATYSEAKSACGDKLEDEDYYERSRQAYKKFANVFTKLQGKESELTKRLQKGFGKPQVGAEDPKAVTKDFIHKGYKDDQKETDSDIENSEKELTTKAAAQAKANGNDGYEVKQVTDKGDYYYDETTETQESDATNIVTTIQAASFYAEANSTTVTATIPKDTKVLYDTAYTDERGIFLRVAYGGKNGYIHKTCVGQKETVRQTTQKVFSAAKDIPFFKATTDTVPMLEIPSGGFYMLDITRNTGNYAGAKVVVTDNGKSNDFEGFIRKTDISGEALTFANTRSAVSGIRGTADHPLGAYQVVVALAETAGTLMGIVASVVGIFQTRKRLKTDQKTQEQNDELLEQQRKQQEIEQQMLDQGLMYNEAGQIVQRPAAASPTPAAQGSSSASAIPIVLAGVAGVAGLIGIVALSMGKNR